MSFTRFGRVINPPTNEYLDAVDKENAIKEEKAYAKRVATEAAIKLATELPQIRHEIREKITISVNDEDDELDEVSGMEVEGKSSSACDNKKRKNVETVWSELVAAWLFVVSDEEKSQIANKIQLKQSINRFCMGQNPLIEVDPAKKDGYFADLDLSSRKWSQIKSYINNFNLPAEFSGNPVLHIWCSGKNFEPNTVPSVLNAELQDPKDRQGDFFFQVARPLYEGHPYLQMPGVREKLYYGSANIKTTIKDPFTNFSAYKIMSEHDVQFCLQLFQDTIASVIGRDEIIALNRNDMNNEFSIHDHVFWEFIGIVLFDEKDNIFARRLTECIYAMRAQQYYACYKYDGTEVTNFKTISAGIDPSKTTITQDVDKTQSSSAAKLFFKFNTFYRNGNRCEEYNGELRFKNPKQCTPKSRHAPQIILTKSNIGGGGFSGSSVQNQNVGGGGFGGGFGGASFQNQNIGGGGFGGGFGGASFQNQNIGGGGFGGGGFGGASFQNPNRRKGGSRKRKSLRRRKTRRSKKN